MTNEMKIQRIIFTTDFSEFAQAALGLATSLARDHRATLLIASVVEPAMPVAAMTPAAPAPVAPPPTSTRETSNEQLRAVVPADPSIAFEHRLLEGSPGDVIVTLAKDEQADLIVMATHGRSGLTRLLMGSVAEHVVRHAPCPVLTVSPRATPESSS